MDFFGSIKMVPLGGGVGGPFDIFFSSKVCRRKVNGHHDREINSTTRNI